MDIIEIPFGAKDSEIEYWECTIPEGMEAVIENGKVIVRQKASEDERIRNGLISFLRSPFIKENLTDERVAPWIAYLEKQKEQKPAEWSEEDSVHLKNAILSAEKEWGNESCTAKWLKSLCPSWKPSEEQMEALRLSFEEAFDDAGDCNRYRRLKSLYEQLKRL